MIEQITTSSLWFKSICTWFVLLIPLKIYTYLKRENYIDKILKLPVKNGNKIINSQIFITKWYKIYLWLSPFQLIVLPYLIYKFSREDFFETVTLIILIHIVIATDFIYRSSIIKKIKLSEVI